MLVDNFLITLKVTSQYLMRADNNTALGTRVSKTEVALSRQSFACSVLPRISVSLRSWVDGGVGHEIPVRVCSRDFGMRICLRPSQRARRCTSRFFRAIQTNT